MATIVVPTTGTVITSAWGKSVADEANAIGTWAAYTPTLTGTLGNGVFVARWTRIGQKTVVAGFRFTMGSTTSLTAGVVRIGLPVPGVVTDASVVGNAYVDTPFGITHGLAIMDTASAVSINTPITNINTVIIGQLMNTHLSAGKIIIARVTYELA